MKSQLVGVFLGYTSERALLLIRLHIPLNHPSTISFSIYFPLLHYSYISLYSRASEYTLLIPSSVGVRAYIGGLQKPLTNTRMRLGDYSQRHPVHI